MAESDLAALKQQLPKTDVRRTAPKDVEKSESTRCSVRAKTDAWRQ